jgi:LPXTG-motif cell wall-anchored protein
MNRKWLLWGGLAGIGVVGYVLYRRKQTATQAQSSTGDTGTTATPVYMVGSNGYLPGHSLYVNNPGSGGSSASGGGTVAQSWSGGNPPGSYTGVSANG